MAMTIIERVLLAFIAGDKTCPDLPNFMKAMNGEHGEECQETMGIKCKHCNRQSHGMCSEEAKNPGQPMFL